MLAKVTRYTPLGHVTGEPIVHLERGQIVEVIGPYRRTKEWGDVGSVIIRHKGQEGWLWLDEIEYEPPLIQLGWCAE